MTWGSGKTSRSNFYRVSHVLFVGRALSLGCRLPTRGAKAARRALGKEQELFFRRAGGGIPSLRVLSRSTETIPSRALDVSQIQDIVESFAAAARRALETGFQVLEIPRLR